MSKKMKEKKGWGPQFKPYIKQRIGKIVFISKKKEYLLCVHLISVLHLKHDGSDPSLDEERLHLLLSMKQKKSKSFGLFLLELIKIKKNILVTNNALIVIIEVNEIKP